MFLTLTTACIFYESIMIWSFLSVFLMFFIFHLKDKIELKSEDDYKKFIKIASKRNPSGDDDEKSSWKKWFEKHYVKIILGLMIASGLYVYIVYLNTYDQQEYLYLITKEGSPIPEKCKQGLSLRELGISKEIFPPYINLMDHRGFNMQRNFAWVTNILVQLEDKMLIFNNQFEMALNQGVCEQISEMYGYSRMVALEKTYLKIMASDNPFRRALVAWSLLEGGPESIDGFDLSSFLKPEDFYVAHKWEYFRTATNSRTFPYSEVFK